ncbi:NAD-dependent deacetylase [Syntrophus gentianae]|uniref:protein acetyllysine N-acetyltransferase n=1 Tax=Syntrophus gentianae TaxID=43775 RepID=A0A1H7WKD4_9BACT|nr:Sir2 family NAD-dependent protein deacetylase [Syntrophus gentianae]SEM22102.1 NAD-dependent deacetylase [Syntrophus gentianae]
MTEEGLEKKIRAVADMICEAGKVVVFTGAGVSTESGIPDFRSPGGLWDRFDPDDFTIQKFLRSAQTRRKQWRILIEGGAFAEAQPNRAHLAVAELEKLGKLRCVITQNIDNLHQKAGNAPERVYELHGNMRWLKCLSCGDRISVPDMLQRTALRELDGFPFCERCQGLLKPDVIFFGEALPEDTLREATYEASNCDLMLVIGSSLVVYPAAYMPQYAKDVGAKLVIINREETPYDAEADILLQGGAGEMMTRILAAVKDQIDL